MLPKIKHFPVNWADGMLIGKEHFIAHDNALYDQLRDVLAQQLTDFNYGLLPPLPNQKSALDIFVDVEQASSIRIEVKECRAVTRGGVRIEIGTANQQTLNVPIAPLMAEYDLSDFNNQEFDIIIVVNPFSRVPVGEIDPEENPPRHKHTMPQYLLEIVPSEQINRSEFSAYHLPVGRLQAKVGNVKFAEYFIPPCTTVNSHLEMQKKYREYASILSDLSSSTTQIVRKIKSKSEPSPLADNMAFLVQRLAFFIADNLDNFRTCVPQQSPLYMVMTFLGFIRHFKTALRCMVEEDREELLKYISDWVDMTPGEFDNMLDSTLHLEYDHYDTSSTFEQLNKCIEILVILFDKLKQLDFIGYRKEVQRPLPPPPPPPKKEEKRSPSFVVKKQGETIVKKDMTRN